MRVVGFPLRAGPRSARSVEDGPRGCPRGFEASQRSCSVRRALLLSAVRRSAAASRRPPSPRGCFWSTFRSSSSSSSSAAPASGAPASAASTAAAARPPISARRALVAGHPPSAQTSSLTVWADAARRQRPRGRQPRRRGRHPAAHARGDERAPRATLGVSPLAASFGPEGLRLSLFPTFAVHLSRLGDTGCLRAAHAKQPAARRFHRHIIHVLINQYMPGHL